MLRFGWKYYNFVEIKFRGNRRDNPETQATSGIRQWRQKTMSSILYIKKIVDSGKDEIQINIILPDILYYKINTEISEYTRDKAYRYIHLPRPQHTDIHLVLFIYRRLYSTSVCKYSINWHVIMYHTVTLLK